MPLSDEEKDAPDRAVATRKRTEMKTIQSYMVLATLAAVNQSKSFSRVCVRRNMKRHLHIAFNVKS